MRSVATQLYGVLGEVSGAQAGGDPKVEPPPQQNPAAAAAVAAATPTPTEEEESEAQDREEELIANLVILVPAKSRGLPPFNLNPDPGARTPPQDFPHFVDQNEGSYKLVMDFAGEGFVRIKYAKTLVPTPDERPLVSQLLPDPV